MDSYLSSRKQAALATLGLGSAVVQTVDPDAFHDALRLRDMDHIKVDHERHEQDVHDSMWEDNLIQYS